MLIIIDALNCLYRSFYVLPKLRNSKGHPIGAIYGMLRIINNLINRYRPSHFVIVFDTKRKSFRHKLFSHYKTNRSATPNDLNVQIKTILFFIEAIGLTSFYIDGFEADDLIGTISKQAENQNYNVLIKTNDKDMLQLVTPNIFLLNKNKELRPEYVIKKYGFEPILIADFLSLVGDRVDNIPGVPGIGEKTAKILINRFKTIKYLYKNLDSIYNIKTFYNTATLISSLKKYKDSVFLFYLLTKIKTDIKININFNSLKIKSINKEYLLDLFKFYELSSILDIEKTVFG